MNAMAELCAKDELNFTALADAVASFLCGIDDFIDENVSVSGYMIS